MANIDNLDISIRVTNLTSSQIKNIQDLTKSLSSLDNVLSDTLMKKLEGLSNLKINVNLDKLKEVDNVLKDIHKNAENLPDISNKITQPKRQSTKRTAEQDENIKELNNRINELRKMPTSLGKLGELRNTLDEKTYGNVKEVIPELQEYEEKTKQLEELKEQRKKVASSGKGIKLPDVASEEVEELTELSNAAEFTKAKLVKTTVALKNTAEGMREVTTETKQLGNSMATYVDGNLTKVTTKAGKTSKVLKVLSKFGKSVIRIAMYRAIRAVLKKISQAVKFAIDSLAAFDDRFRKTMTNISSATMNLKASFAGSFAGIIQSVEPFIVNFLNHLTEINNKFSMIIADIQGMSTYTKVLTDYQEEYNKQIDLLPFDKFNVLQKDKRYGGFKTEKVNKNKIINSPELNVIKSTMKAFKELGGSIFELVGKIFKVIGDIANILSPLLLLLNPIFDILSKIVDEIGLVFDNLHNVFGADSPIGISIKTFLNICVIPLQVAFETISGVLQVIFETLKSIFTLDFRNFNERIKNAFDFSGINTNNRVGKNFKDKFLGWSGWKKIGDFFKGKYFAGGGVPNVGTQFIAGEHGAELVGNMSSGKTGVMNMQQLHDAIYKGMVSAIATMQNVNKGGESQPIIVNISDEKLFEITRQSAKRRGLDFVNI